MVNMPPSIPARISFTVPDVEAVIAEFRQRLEAAVQKHGDGCCWSTHEISGVIDEEVLERNMAQHKNDLVNFKDELFDGMIANAWGIISINKGVVTGKW